MKTSVSDYKEYTEGCLSAAEDDSKFATFRQNPQLQEIWEHVNESMGRRYFDIINKHPYGQEMKKRAIKNDICGLPKVFRYDGEVWSPTTLRYIKVALDLYDMIGPLLFSAHIIEVGGGYGGLATIINTSGKYEIYDLPSVCKLIDKYCDIVCPDNNIITVDSIVHYKNFNNPDLFISNYAWTELDKDIQMAYFDGTIKNASHGYITCNFISSYFQIASLNEYEIVELLGKVADISIVQEQPISHQDNKIIRW